MTYFLKREVGLAFDAGGKERHIAFAFSNPSASGNTQLVAAQGGLKIVVLEVCVITSSAMSVKFQSATNDISCAWPLATNGGMVLPLSEHGWMQTNIGEALNINLSLAFNTAVQIAWIPSL